MKIWGIATFLMASVAIAHVDGGHEADKPVLADLKDLEALGLPVLYKNNMIGVGYSVLSDEQVEMIHSRAHQVGKCGGFEDLSAEVALFSKSPQMILEDLARINEKNQIYQSAPYRLTTMSARPEITTALEQVSESNLLETVRFLSAFKNRYNKDAEPNKHIEPFMDRIREALKDSPLSWELSTVSHKSTKQVSIKVRLPGKTRPQEVVVMGGHLDSITQSWFGKEAPGADDNASGSANLLEALRILAQQPQTERTVEFFWYAGEESGLLGSAEIARQYKDQKINVVAVLQLDMTLYPGSGELTIANMSDFTSAWLRDYLKAANDTYLGVRMVDDRCGYGCSDHASWHRQGFATVFPTESVFRQSNRNIHSSKDIISPELSFKHSAVFTKLAIVLGMDLANSQDSQPY